MTFTDFYTSVKRIFNEHSEIVCNADTLSVQINDIYENSFYILYKKDKIFIEPFPYNDYDVCITATQKNLELLFKERQYLFLAY